MFNVYLHTLIMTFPQDSDQFIVWTMARLGGRSGRAVSRARILGLNICKLCRHVQHANHDNSDTDDSAGVSNLRFATKSHLIYGICLAYARQSIFILGDASRLYRRVLAGIDASVELKDKAVRTKSSSANLLPLNRPVNSNGIPDLFPDTDVSQSMEQLYHEIMESRSQMHQFLSRNVGSAVAANALAPPRMIPTPSSSPETRYGELNHELQSDDDGMPFDNIDIDISLSDVLMDRNSTVARPGFAPWNLPLIQRAGCNDLNYNYDLPDGNLDILASNPAPQLDFAVLHNPVGLPSPSADDEFFAHSDDEQKGDSNASIVAQICQESLQAAGRTDSSSVFSRNCDNPLVKRRRRLCDVDETICIEPFDTLTYASEMISQKYIRAARTKPLGHSIADTYATLFGEPFGTALTSLVIHQRKEWVTQMDSQSACVRAVNNVEAGNVANIDDDILADDELSQVSAEIGRNYKNFSQLSAEVGRHNNSPHASHPSPSLGTFPPGVNGNMAYDTGTPLWISTPSGNSHMSYLSNDYMYEGRDVFSLNEWENDNGPDYALDDCQSGNTYECNGRNNIEQLPKWTSCSAPVTFSEIYGEQPRSLKCQKFMEILSLADAGVIRLDQAVPYGEIVMKSK